MYSSADYEISRVVIFLFLLQIVCLDDQQGAPELHVLEGLRNTCYKQHNLLHWSHVLSAALFTQCVITNRRFPYYYLTSQLSV